jgi:hypothetical protein
MGILKKLKTWWKSRPCCIDDPDIHICIDCDAYWRAVERESQERQRHREEMKEIQARPEYV